MPDDKDDDYQLAPDDIMDCREQCVTCQKDCPVKKLGITTLGIDPRKIARAWLGGGKVLSIEDRIEVATTVLREQFQGAPLMSLREQLVPMALMQAKEASENVDKIMDAAVLYCTIHRVLKGNLDVKNAMIDIEYLNALNIYLLAVLEAQYKFLTKVWKIKTGDGKNGT